MAVILNEVGDEQGLEQSMVVPVAVCVCLNGGVPTSGACGHVCGRAPIPNAPPSHQGSAAAPDNAAPTWMELTNGCLCCSVKSEFVQALEALLQSSHTYDYVLIEATGTHTWGGCVIVRCVV